MPFDSLAIFVVTDVEEADLPLEVVLNFFASVQAAGPSFVLTDGCLLRDASHEVHQFRIAKDDLLQILRHVSRLLLGAYGSGLALPLRLLVDMYEATDRSKQTGDAHIQQL